jgi:hypothetical protein
MAIDPNEISQEEYNQKITSWGQKLGVKIRASISSLAVKGKGDLLSSLRTKAYKWYGEVDRIAYGFDRHGVFWHKGVGRGHIMQGGMVVRGYKPGKVLKAAAVNAGRIAEPQILKSGTVNRKPVEWFNPVVAENIGQLADLVAELQADRAVNATKMLIN